MANLFDQANERKKWDATIAQVGQMGYPQNPAQPPAFTSPQPRRPNSFGDAAAATSNPGVTQLPPSATQGSAPGPSRLYMQDRADELRTQVGAGNYAQAAGTAARTAVQGLGMYGIELADKLATPAINAAASFGRGVMGAGSQAAPTTTPATTLASAVPGAPPQAAPTAPNPTDQRLATGAQQPSGNSPVGMSVADAQKQGLVGERVGYDPAYDQRLTGAPGQNGAVTRNGNSYAGTNVSGDITVNGQAPGGGVVSAQNMVAADALQARQPPAGFQPAGSQPAGVQAPIVRNSTNDWAARNNLRNASVSASSITNNGGEFDRSGPGDSAAMAEYKAALATDQALQQAQPGADITAMRENAGIQREGMQQQGATTRTGMQERGSMGRTMAQAALEQQKINQAGESQGFANRAAAQSEQQRGVLLDPNATPEQRSVAQRNLAALSGKTAADRMQTVTLPDTTNEMGQVVRGGQALVRTLEDGTVQQVPIGTQRGATAPLANHVAALKANPKQAAQFDEIYGPGAAARAIGK